MTIRRHPLPQQPASAPPAPDCDLPPPAEAGRVYNPPHPLWGIAFLFCVALALLWGALRTPTAGSWPKSLSIAYAGLCVCLGGVVHFVELVELRHVPAKLGLRRPSLRWMGVALLASAGACFAVATGHPAAGGLRDGTMDTRAHDITMHVPTGTLVAMLALGALWHEGFCRGYAFRALMRRHGFWISAGIAAPLGALLLFFLASIATSRGFSAVTLEVPLAFALSQLFESAQSLWPCVLVRFALLLALFAGAVWPAAVAFVVVWAAMLLAARRASRRMEPESLLG